MTTEEYGTWILAPEALPHMIETRRLVEAAQTAFTHQVATVAGRIN